MTDTDLNASMECGNCTKTATNITSPTVMSDGSQIALHVLFGVIASLAFVSNGVLILIVLRNRPMLKSSYNVLILCLAATDMLTGVLLVVTPPFIIGLEDFPTPSGIAGELFCRIIVSQYFVYMLGKVSVFTVTCMAIERWYSVARPTRYKRTFQNKRVCWYLLVIWITSCAAHTQILLAMKLDHNKQNCVWLPLYAGHEIVATSFTLVTYFVPTLAIWVTYMDIAIKLKVSAATTVSAQYSRARLRMIRTCVIVAILLTLCWFPNQLYYTLSAYGVLRLETPFHRFTIVLAMSNSIVNPYVYCLNNSEYRRGLISLFRGEQRRTFGTSSTNDNLQSTSISRDTALSPALIGCSPRTMAISPSTSPGTEGIHLNDIKTVDIAG